MTVVMLAIFVTIYEIFTIEMCITLTWILKRPRSNLNMLIESPFLTYFFAMVIFVQSVIIYEILENQIKF